MFQNHKKRIVFTGIKEAVLDKHLDDVLGEGIRREGIIVYEK